MGLGLRDLSVLLVVLLILLISLSQEGDLALERDFFFPILDTQGAGGYSNGNAPLPHEVVPAPLITDIDGDGQNEIVVVTREPKLKILRAKDKNVNHLTQIAWDQLETLHETSLLSSVYLKAGRQCVALSSGYLKAYSRSRNRRQVIVVVTEGFTVQVYSASLKLLWERSIEADFSQKYLAEVAILVDAHPMRTNDTGVVVVGGRLAQKKELVAYQMHHDNQAHNHEQGNEFADPSQRPGRILRPNDAIVDMAGGEEEQETLMKDPLTFGKDQHFSYYAFEGKTGDSRWKHDSSSFVEESAGSALLRPQHELHTGEVDWRNYRTAILHALPHSWNGDREDTFFDLAYFERTRSGHDRQSKRKRKKVQSQYFVKDTFNLRPHRDTEHVENANVLIAHLKDGIEALHFYSGRPLCRLTLSQGAVHVDINGDGVVDHVEVLGGSHLPHLPAKHLADMPDCLAVVRSGIPSSRVLFNGSVCAAGFKSLFTRGQFSRGSMAKAVDNALGVAQTEDKKKVLVAHPIVLQDPLTVGKSLHRRRWQAFFFENSGVVTSFNHDGTKGWQTFTKSSWLMNPKESDGSLSDAQYALRPSLVPYSLTPESPADHILATGESVLSLVTQFGTVRSSALAKEEVVSHPIIGDYNNDGVNDIILITSKGYYGLLVSRRLGGQLFSVLVIFLLLILSMVFAFKISTSGVLGSGKPRAATTVPSLVQSGHRSAASPFGGGGFKGFAASAAKGAKLS